MDFSTRGMSTTCRQKIHTYKGFVGCVLVVYLVFNGPWWCSRMCPRPPSPCVCLWVVRGSHTSVCRVRLGVICLRQDLNKTETLDQVLVSSIRDDYFCREGGDGGGGDGERGPSYDGWRGNILLPLTSSRHPYPTLLCSPIRSLSSTSPGKARRSRGEREREGGSSAVSRKGVGRSGTSESGERI